MFDATIIRAHGQLPPAPKGAAMSRRWALRGGLSSNIHLLGDEARIPVAFRITAGQATEYAQAIRLPESRETEAVIADKG